MPVPEITELARRIARSDPENEEEQQELRGLLSELRQRVQGEKAHDVRLRLDSALLLTEYMSTLGTSGGDEILRIVSRLVASLETYFNPAVTIRKPREGEQPFAGLVEGKRVEGTGGLSHEAEREHALMSDMLLGEILVQFGTINSTDVCSALELQNQKQIRFGDALMELGAATRADVMSAIAYQDTLRREATGRRGPVPAAPLPTFRPLRKDLKLVSDMLLGDLMVKLGTITPEDLEKGLRAHRATGARLGEALVQMGATTWKSVEQALRVQNERRVSVL